MRYLLATLLFYCFVFYSSGQSGSWQQSVKYVMDVKMNVETHRYSGTQELTYSNNSPDTLHKVFFHLYYNAFQPNSMMDIRSRTIADPDPRVRDRISKLSPEEIGYLQVNRLSMDGKDLDFEQVETILEVRLSDPILPHTSVRFQTSFEGQVPLMMRRA